MIQTSKRFPKLALAGIVTGALTLGSLPLMANAETIEPGQPGSIYSSPMKNWTSIGIPRQQTDGSMVAEGTGFTNRATITNASGIPVATGTGAKFAYNYQNVELTIESEWQTASPSASPTALQVNMAEGYYDSYKDTCLSAGGYAAGEVVTCNAKRLVTYTFSEPVWFPKFGNIYTTSGLRDAQGNIELVQFEEMKVLSINDGNSNRSSTDFNGGDLPFYPTYRIGGYSEWFTDGKDAQGNYINTLDLSKYALDADGFNRYTAKGAVPGNNTPDSAFPQFGVPGLVKSITLEYTPKILVNDPTVVDEWNAGVTRIVSGVDQPVLLKDLLDWNAEGSAPRQFRYGAYLPRTDYTVTKDFTQADGVTPVAEPTYPGGDVYFNVTVENNGGMKSWGYVALDDMPAELDPNSVELVSVTSTQGDADTNTYVGTTGGTSVLASPGTKVEVVDGKFRVFRVGKDYKITGGNDTVTGTPDYVNGTNIGRVLPKDPTNTTKRPVGGLTPGQKDTYVFKAKVKQLSALQALGTGLCETNTPILNQVAAYDSVVNPNDASRDDAALTIECPKPAIALDKSTDFDATTAKVGDTVTYTFTVTNTGNIALETFDINDPLPGLSEITYPADRTLAVGESKTATATYVLTDKDVVAGEIVNTATATGVPVDPTPNDKTDELPPNPTSDPDSETIVVTADPAFDFDKYIKDKAAYDPKTAKAGDVITYVFKVTNTGNITLSTFEINDPLPGLSEINYPANQTLAVGESKEATATYVLTDKDVVAGQVVNTATASVVPVDPTPEDPSDNVPPPAPKTDDENIVLTPNPDFDFDKSTNFKFADAKVGDTVTYNFKVTNTGNMTLSTFEINDPLPGLSKLTYPADRTLAVGESKTATATYVLTEADFAAGKVVNAAEASVVPVDPTPEDPSDNVPPPAPKTDEVEIPLTIKPGISLVKTAKQTMVNKVGEKIDYNFKVTNTGNTNLENITVSETAFTGKGALPVPVCPENVVLAPGESITCTAIYTVVKADIDAGVAIDNTAVATGEVPGGNGKTPPVTSDPSSATVKVSKSGKLAHTGAETTNALALAGLLLVAGATMSVRNRKQKA